MHRSVALGRNILRTRSLERLVARKNSRNFSSRHAAGAIVARRSPLVTAAKSQTLLRCCGAVHQTKLLYSSDGNLPEHYTVALPALSPTMEMGTIVRWTKEEGDQLNEGDLLAEIETDKATMGFETPEEGFLAKIVVPGGTKDVAIGKLVCIIVAEQSDVAAFNDYVHSESDVPSTSSSAQTTEDAPVTAGTSIDYPTHHTVSLPALSPTMEQGNIAGWAKQEGDELAEGDVLAQIETDKATMDFETPEEGYLAKIIVPEGTKNIPLGKLLCIIVENKEDIAAFADYQAPVQATSAPTPATKPSAPPSQAPPAPKPKASAPAPHPPTQSQLAAAPKASTGAAAPRTSTPPVKTGGRVFATPYAKRLAADRGIDLSTVPGSGPDGQIRAQDVETFVPSAVEPSRPAEVPVQGAPTPAPVRGQDYTDIPLTNMRKTIAKRLVESKQTIPHYYLSVDINVDKINKLRQELNQLLSKEEIKLSVNDFIIKAASLACKKVPEVNSSWQDDFIREYHSVDISVAVATPGGLLTPIVYSAQRKGLATINTDVKLLAKKAREGKLRPEEFIGGTFTISNLGMFGIKNFTAVINPPQSCILAVGGADQRMIPDENMEKGFRVVNMMGVTLSCDHRVVDGAVGAQWLAQFKNLLEVPETMLL